MNLNIFIGYQTSKQSKGRGVDSHIDKDKYEYTDQDGDRDIYGLLR